MPFTTLYRPETQRKKYDLKLIDIKCTEDAVHCNSKLGIEWPLPWSFRPFGEMYDLWYRPIQIKFNLNWPDWDIDTIFIYTVWSHEKQWQRAIFKIQKHRQTKKIYCTQPVSCRWSRASSNILRCMLVMGLKDPQASRTTSVSFGPSMPHAGAVFTADTVAKTINI